MTDTHNALLAALAYLDREGTMTASEVGFFAIGDPWLFDRLCSGRAVSDREIGEALPFVVRVVDQVIAKLSGQREALSAAMVA